MHDFGLLFTGFVAGVAAGMYYLRWFAFKKPAPKPNQLWPQAILPLN